MKKLVAICMIVALGVASCTSTSSTAKYAKKMNKNSGHPKGCKR